MFRFRRFERLTLSRRPPPPLHQVYEFDKQVQYRGWFLLFCFYWTLNFITAMGQVSSGGGGEEGTFACTPEAFWRTANLKWILSQAWVGAGGCTRGRSRR